MRMVRGGFEAWAPAAAALMLAACATQSALPPPVAQTTPTPRPAPGPGSVGAVPLPPLAGAQPALSWSRLPGWDQEDHEAALDMFRASCGVEKDAAWREVCLRARDLGPQDEVIAKAFWETNFRIRPVGEAGSDEGLLTGYFAPEYPARASRSYPFTVPVRPRPADLPPADVGASGGAAPWLDRAAIEATGEAQPLAWMKPEDLFFLQIQGSGVLDLPDGRKLKAVYAANNGQPFVGIATAMRQQGLLAADNTSGEAIRAWLADHRGPSADAVMRLNPRYIFFTLQPWDGKEPAGAAGVTLTPGRALAVDPARHDYGALYWIDGEAPSLSGAFPTYRRLAMALDTGSAIKGEVRADLYLGMGATAGAEAGRVKHRLKLYRLTPVLDPTLASR
ncbi:MAG: MltA domain-containing protein [Caulobacteraceae bacterium]